MGVEDISLVIDASSTVLDLKNRIEQVKMDLEAKAVAEEEAAAAVMAKKEAEDATATATPPASKSNNNV